MGRARSRLFIELFGSILRLHNILTSFDEFAGNEILSERDYQDYQSLYLDHYGDLRRAADSEKESISDDVVLAVTRRLPRRGLSRRRSRVRVPSLP